MPKLEQGRPWIGVRRLEWESIFGGAVLSFSLQTIAIAAECADDLAVHPHFKVVKALANALGYRLV